MKKNLILLLIYSFPLITFAQAYQRDSRSTTEKEDEYNRYNADHISKVQILKALEVAGINIFNIPLKPFDKRYLFDIILSEYRNGEKIRERSIGLMNDNTYRYYKSNDRFANKASWDYIDQLTFFARDLDSLSLLKVESYSGTLQGIKLKKLRTRGGQDYSWRSYSKTGWLLNQKIPLLVYASSWWDEKYSIERFCGTVDLSSDLVEAQTLLASSPHYYVISYIVSEPKD